MASTRFAASVFGIMIIVLIFLAHEAYGSSGANIARRKALRDGKMEVFMKEGSGVKKHLDKQPKISESYGSEKTPQETTDQVSAENAADEGVNATHRNDYGEDQPPHGRRKPPINNNDPKH